MKTRLFWQMEETDRKYWITGNVLNMVHGCMCRLKEWIASRNVHIYFIPDNNMIDHTTESELQQVEGVVHSIMCDLWSS
jgi:hypothetical protein